MPAPQLISHFAGSLLLQNIFSLDRKLTRIVINCNWNGSVIPSEALKRKADGYCGEIEIAAWSVQVFGLLTSAFQAGLLEAEVEEILVSGWERDAVVLMLEIIRS